MDKFSKMKVSGLASVQKEEVNMKDIKDTDNLYVLKNRDRHPELDLSRGSPSREDESEGENEDEGEDENYKEMPDP